MYSIKEYYGFLLGKALQKIDRTFSDELSQSDLTLKEFGTMLIVSENPGITQKEAGNIQQIDRTSIGKIIDSLEQKEILMREVSPLDRRAYRLKLTSGGEKLFHEFKELVYRSEEEALSVLTTEEKEQLLTLLKKIVKEEENEQT